MCKKEALVGFFQVKNHYNKLFDKKFNTHIKDNSCDNNTSKSDFFFHVSALWKNILLFSSERGKNSVFISCK